MAFSRTISPLIKLLKATDTSLFPPACPACEKRLSNNEQFLCDDCRALCLRQPPAGCPRCGHPHPAATQEDHLCSHCLTKPPTFNWLKAAGIYQGLLADLLQQFKFHHKTSLASPLAGLILQQQHHAIEQFAADVIVPTPLHPQRLRERGYNQAQLIGQALGKHLNLPVNNTLLIRQQPTAPQTTLSLNQRMDNMRGVFYSPTAPRSKILLVDDIATTTSTARSCCQTLAEHGHQVAVIVVARALLTH